MKVGDKQFSQPARYPPTYHTARVYVVQIVSQRKSTQSVRRLSWLLLIIIIIVLAIIIVREFLVLRFVRDDIEQLKIFLIGSGAAHPAKRCVINQNF